MKSATDIQHVQINPLFRGFVKYFSGDINGLRVRLYIVAAAATVKTATK